jgi:hypothetical protein
MTNNHSDNGDARYGEAILYLLRYVRSRIRVCAHARWPRGTLCFTITKEA